MTFVIDTVGKITLPTGETCQGVILTSDDPADIRKAARHWAGRVTLSPEPGHELHDALKTLNAAAYAVIRAGRDTTEYPDLDRQTLREICRMTDKLVDDNALTIIQEAAQ